MCMFSGMQSAEKFVRLPGNYATESRPVGLDPGGAPVLAPGPSTDALPLAITTSLYAPANRVKRSVVPGSPWWAIETDVWGRQF